MATRILEMCSTKIAINIDGKKDTIALNVPSGDLKYKSFWVMDSAMIAECDIMTAGEIKTC